MRFLDAYAPWGSPVVPQIGLPPFADETAHRECTRMMQLHLALLDGGGPSLSTVALSSALERSGTVAGDDDGRWLTALELAVSLTTWFPAPWTPEALARSLARAHGGSPVRRGKGWTWFSDPDFTAMPIPGGGWSITRHERGDRVSEPVRDDRDLVVLWLSHFRARFGFPLGHAHDAADVSTLAPATLAVIASDERDAAFPYRSTWRAERDAALTTARSATDQG